MSLMEKLVSAMTAAIESGQVSVAQLAAAAGCSRQYVYTVLDGKSIPTVAIAEKLAEAVGASLQLVSRRSKKISA